MLLSNRFAFFDKKGDNINPQKRQTAAVLIIDDGQFPGIGAVINAYTNFEGQVIYIEILDGGSSYNPETYIEIRSIDNNDIVFTIESSDITFGPNGEIQAIVIPNTINNNDFPTPAVDYILDFSLERVSTGLIAVDQIYILENVFDANGKSTYTFPRIENYGPFNINSFSANGTSAKIETESFTFTGLVRSYDPNTVARVPSAVISDLVVGMTVTGTGVPANTFIFNINVTNQTILLTNPIPEDAIGDITFTAYFPHDLRVGSKIVIDGGALDGGPYTITKVDTFNVYFDTNLTVPNTVSGGVSYSVVPQFKAYLEGDDSFFLFNVDYNEDYPTITKSPTLEFELAQAASSDVIPTSPIGGPANNVLYQRTVYEGLQKTPFALNIGHQSDVEGVFLSILRIIDNTFASRPGLLFYSVYRAETEAEDERLGILLSNIGRDVDADQELILRDSEVDESNVNYILLNQKRKEMLLQGDQIWPYMGSYRGLVNMINWFGYYDIRLKEYFLNVNSMDTEFGTYRQVPVTFQLKNKKPSGQSLNIVPSKHYKKTSMFGLFYDLVRDSGNFDENGIPVTTDAFTFTNEEALIKFFALKKFLKEKFLPLNCQITDITGEGVYYERYTINSWKDIDERRVLELTRPINFDCEDRAIVEDLRPYTSEAYLSPTLDKTFQSFMNKYDILDISIANPGGPYTSIPLVTFPGSSNQQATGYVKMKGYTGTYTLANPAGVDFVVGEIITVSGGTFDTPLRLVVAGVNGSGAVTDVQILSGYYQGAGYTAFPQTFGQALVVAPIGNQYEVVNRTGFTAAPTDLGFQVDDVWFLNKGLGYSTYPQAAFTPNIGSTVADLDLKIYDGTPVGNINNANRTERWNDAPNIPVGAVASLSTSFPITWDEVPYAWFEVGGSSDANVKVHIDPLPSGTGEVIAAEIVNPGTEYKFVPSLKVVSEQGSGATLSSSLRKGRLNLLEYTVTAVSSTGGGTNNEFTVNPDIALAGSLNVTTNRLVTGSNISEIVLTSTVTPGVGTSTIIVEKYDSTPATTSVAIGDKILVHQGVEVTNGGGGYSNVPGVNVNSGHTRSIFTWEDLGRGEFYQMQWKVVLTEPVKPTAQFSYDSGIQPIDILEDHTVILPYIGKYTVEMVVYNTDNNFANLIKKNCIEVYMAESDFSYIAKFVNECVDTWDSLYQLPNTQQNQTEQEIENTRYIEYKWDNATGRWVNLVFNDTSWEDMDFRWNNTDITDLSVVNNYNFPFCEDYTILEISPEDNLEGPVLEYRDSTTTPSAINPTIIVSGQRAFPEIEAPYNSANEWIFIRRDDTVFQLDVLDADYSTPGYTYIELVNEPPSAFKSSPTTWEVLREIGGTIVLPGNKIYNVDSNPNGIQVGKFLKVFQKNTTPIRKRVPINAKNTYSGQPSSIGLTGEGNDTSFFKKGEIGKIYKLRDNQPLNGDLSWDPVVISSTWVIEPANTDNPEVRDHIGKIYIKPSATCNPLTEIRPGFTEIKLYAYLDGTLKYTQTFRTTHVYQDASTVGFVYNIWGASGAYVIDVVGIDGGPIDELNSYLLNLASQGIEDVYLEYEYNEFPTRTYYGVNQSGDAVVYFDFNMYPSSGEFNNAPVSEFNATAINNHTNWFFDSGITSGDFSMEVSQVGSWQGGVGTIITVSDIDNDLLRTSSSFMVCQRNFDEDSAERKLGTEIITWQNYRDTVWQDTCSLTWNTIDFSTPYWCNFVISGLVQNSGLRFNEDDAYNFTGILGGMSNAQIYAQALYELNTQTIGGLAKFHYFPVSTSDISLVAVKIDTYQGASSFVSNTAINIGDVIYGEPFEANTTVTGVAGTTYTVDKALKKKASFIGDCFTGEYKIKNITGLLENQIAPGDMISSQFLPVSPATPATVTNVFVQQGMVREITLSAPFTGDGDAISFFAEYGPATISTQVLSGALGTTFKIVAQAKTPSVNCLGYLTGDGGLTFETPDGNLSSLSHNFPTGNYYSWIGFGENKVGSFLNGLDDFVNNYRNIQVYLNEGISPFGYQGWYPAFDLPLPYSFIASPAFSNSAQAEADSQRLPYERSIGGALTWEETWASDTNGRFPTGSSVILTSDTSKIAGKTKYLWRIKESDRILVETIDPMIMWTFTYPGTFSIELMIEDSNGNAIVRKKDTFIEVNDSIGS